MTCSKWASHPIYVRMSKSGIYSITNLLSGKVYYGSSNDIDGRWRNHKSKLKKGKHPNPHLQSAWNKYGEHNFLFQLVEEVPIEKLQEVEQTYLDWCRVFSFWSYNIGYDAECATRGMKFGPPSKEHRRKIGLANKGSNSANFGNKLSDETCRRMSLSKKGVPKPPRTEEHKRNLSIACQEDKHYRYDEKVYTFYHPSFGTEKCTRHDLMYKYELHKKGISMILTRSRKSYRQWSVI